MTHLSRFRAHPSILFALTVAGALCGCTQKDLTAAADAGGAAAATTRALQGKVDTIVVIYAENRAFDNLYGNFPGARNLSEVIDRRGKPLPSYVPQKDRNGAVLPVLPPSWGGVTAAGVTPVVTQQQSVGLPNAPYSIEHGFTAQSQVTLSADTVTRDLWHRFYEHQMQIDGGKNDGYAAWSDAGGLAMGYYDYSRSSLYALAKQFVLADQF
ncbi:MAG TPA: alkaline phosphatase family protein, partial [Steroidobacteraceae bacterium]|nr:alkaline phosphatase family protein [Steroidobacteraceae bacterium]